MHLQENTVLTLTLGQRSHKILPSALYIMWPMQLQILKLGRPAVKKKMNLQENILFDLGRMNYCLVSYASRDICTDKVWSCYVQQLWKDAFTRKYSIKPWSKGQMSHELLPSALYIIWPVHLQMLKLWRPMV